MTVAADGALSEMRGTMLVALPSYGYRRHATPQVTRALAAASRRYLVMAGFDTGAWLLAQAGLLDGHKATIHWEELAAFEETFPDVSTYGNVISATATGSPAPARWRHLT